MSTLNEIAMALEAIKHLADILPDGHPNASFTIHAPSGEMARSAAHIYLGVSGIEGELHDTQPYAGDEWRYVYTTGSPSIKVIYPVSPADEIVGGDAA